MIDHAFFERRMNTLSIMREASARTLENTSADVLPCGREIPANYVAVRVDMITSSLAAFLPEASSRYRDLCGSLFIRDTSERTGIQQNGT
jgi:hypothetical protein